MGDWGYKPYQTDESADWFGVVFQNFDFIKVENTIMNFNPSDENYEQLRAAAYILQKLCVPMIWTTAYHVYPKHLIETAIYNLNQMITNDNQVWGFLDSWGETQGEESELVKEVKSQIQELETRLYDWIDKN